MTDPVEPTPAPTPTPTPTPVGAVMTAGHFVRKGALLQDLHTSLSSPEPTPNADTVKSQLAIVQECDFNAQLIAGLKAVGEFSLPAYIRRYVRDNTGDVTLLPAMTRHFVNPPALARQASELHLKRVSDADAQILKFAHRTNPAGFQATKNPAWNEVDGVFTFNRKALIQINFVFNCTLKVGARPSSEIEWRYSDSQNNRVVTLTPTVHIEGVLGTGVRQSIALASAVFFPEHYDRGTSVPVRCGLRLSVLDATATFGRIEKISVSMARSSWVAKDTTQVFDTVRFNKQTEADLVDSSNYLELVEI